MQGFELVSNREEKAMATHSSTLAWQIPWTEESGRVQSKGLMSVFPIGLAGEETMFMKFACSQTFSRYSKKHSGFICVFFFFVILFYPLHYSTISDNVSKIKKSQQTNK